MRFALTCLVALGLLSSAHAAKKPRARAAKAEAQTPANLEKMPRYENTIIPRERPMKPRMGRIRGSSNPFVEPIRVRQRPGRGYGAL